uniref:Uncharacterized protein n=1 Tax=Rangifer tarandus platyrhynchus TaxID=3082113 RepID=A0ACB0ECB4_RANTA|nr:unnamed protein product [Rangifer tarandus platyrhynchus]
MLGAGVHILVGAVAKYIAGPAIILSFLVAALSYLLSGLCYIEFGPRVPRSGSIHLYSYSIMGQVYGFIIGWNRILSLTVGLLVRGVHVLPQVNKVFMGINISVLGFIIVSSFIKGDLHNWKLTEQDYTLNTSESDDIHSLLNTMFAMPWLTYTMAEDGLLFRFLARINTRTRTHTTVIMISGNLSDVAMSMMLGQYLRQFGQKLVRRKPQEFREEPESPKFRPPGTLDLVIGLDNMLGAGIYILIGGVAKFVAGPAIILSLLVAGLTTVLSGLCYVELAARVKGPRSGYFVSYVTMGQLYAFITGWNLLLYLIIATACIARAWSSTFDSLIGNHISEALGGTFSLQMPYFLASFPDFLALGLVLLLTGLLALRVYESTLINKVFTGLNILVLSFIIVSGFIKGDLDNWKLTEQDYTLAAAGAGDASRLGGHTWS